MQPHHVRSSSADASWQLQLKLGMRSKFSSFLVSRFESILANTRQGPIGCFYPSPFTSSIERAMEQVALALRGKRGSMGWHFQFLGVVPELTLAAAGVVNSVRAELFGSAVPVTVFA